MQTQEGVIQPPDLHVNLHEIVHLKNKVPLASGFPERARNSLCPVKNWRADYLDICFPRKKNNRFEVFKQGEGSSHQGGISNCFLSYHVSFLHCKTV